MNPSKQLGGAKTFFAQTLTKNGQTFEVKIKKVGRHGEK
jgi:predicted RNA-binding protein with TRAM domain